MNLQVEMIKQFHMQLVCITNVILSEYRVVDLQNPLKDDIVITCLYLVHMINKQGVLKI